MNEGQGASCGEIRSELSQKARRYDKLYFRALGATLALGVAAAVIALIPGRVPVAVAAVLIAVSVVIELVSDKRRWQANWQTSRDASEMLKAQGFLFQYRAAPYQADEDAERLLTDAFRAYTPGLVHIDQAWADKRNEATTRLLVKSYLKDRVYDQIDYYRDRASRARRTARIASWTSTALIVVALLVAVLEVTGVLGVEAVGAVVAAASSTRAWVSSKHYEDTARVYQSTLDAITKQRSTVVEAKTPAELSIVVERIEQVLAGESSRWLALTNAQIALDKNQRGLA